MPRSKKITKKKAYNLAKRAGVSFSKSSFEQSASAMAALAELAKDAGYRKPKGASGSTGRYFFDHLNRLKKSRKW